MAQGTRCAARGSGGAGGRPSTLRRPGLTAPSATEEKKEAGASRLARARTRSAHARTAHARLRTRASRTLGHACTRAHLDAQRRVLRAAACARRFAPRLGRSTACKPRLARERLRARPTRWHATACERSARTPFARLSCTPSGRTGTVCACKLSGLLAGAATWQQRLPTCSSVLVGEPSSAGGRSPSTFVVRLVEALLKGEPARATRRAHC